MIARTVPRRPEPIPQDQPGGPATPQESSRATTTPRGLRPNRVLWRGRLSAQPALKTSRRGTAYCMVPIAQRVTDPFTGETREQAADLVLTGPQAMLFCSAFRHGDFVEVAGELHLVADHRGTARLRLLPSEDIALIQRSSPEDNA